MQERQAIVAHNTSSLFEHKDVNIQPYDPTGSFRQARLCFALRLAKPGSLVTYAEILTQIMGHHHSEDHQVIYFHMTSLRKKLGTYRRRLKTVRDRSYRYEPQT